VEPDLRRILIESKTIAVVGLSDKPDRPSNEIAAYLKAQGYRIVPVNPTIAEALGERAYPSLRDVPQPVVADAIAIRAKVVWMQTGIVNEGAAQQARAAGLTVVMDACMRETHRTLRGAGEM
jgi:hypothetical protein